MKKANRGCIRTRIEFSGSDTAFFIAVSILVVRFIRIIGQRMHRANPGCPIHMDYRTMYAASEPWLSDSIGLSDNVRSERTLVVRFIWIIGQLSLQLWLLYAEWAVYV